MRKNHETKLKGRFIKNTHPNAKRVQVEDFNLVEICTSDITYTDNQSATIVHQRLHEKSELDQKIKIPKGMDEKFKLENFRPVIKPLDFTADWNKQLTYASKNKTSIEDDEEINPEFLNLAKEIGVETTPEDTKLKSEETTQPEHSPLIISGKSKETNNLQSDIVNDEKNDFFESNSDLVASSDMTNQDHVDNSSVDYRNYEFRATQETPMQDSGSHSVSKENPNIQSRNLHDEFIPMSADMLNHHTPTQDEINEVFENAKAEGYQAGFIQGEEKGTIQAKQNVLGISETLNKIMTELESLKANILHNAQDNFQIICQTMIESLLNHHFKANPEALSSVIKKAMDESIKNDEFTIFVSSQVIENIKDTIDDDLKNKIKASDDIEGFNFKIESNLTVIDGNINQIVADLLEQADLELFTEDERAV